jgi:LytS/YehU family sensor histidine kinase
MINIEQTWSPPTHQTSINYAAMHPGSYTLQVGASSDTVLWSEPIEVSFQIKPAYWQTTTFRFGALGFGILFISFIAYGWTRTIKKKESARRKQLEIENRILQLEQKALQLQMNPHFLFNALTSIKSLVGKSKLEEAQNEINAFALLMRGVLNNSRKQKISLAEEIRVLDAYLHMEQLCHQYKIQYHVHVDPSLDAEEIEIPPMLIQPFVENAIVHGISPLSKEGMVKIDFSQEKDLLVCRIQDNGIGREKAARLRAEKKPGHQPVAMEVTKERLAALKNDKLYEPLIMDDILDMDGNNAGTLVTIKLPLQTNW